MGLPDLERFEYDGVEHRGDLIVQLRRAKQKILTTDNELGNQFGFAG